MQNLYTPAARSISTKKDSPRSQSEIEETKTPTFRDRGVKSRRKVYHLQKLQNGPMTDHDPMTSFSIVSFPGHREESSHSPYWPLQQVFRGQRTPTELSKSPLELHSLSKVYHFLERFQPRSRPAAASQWRLASRYYYRYYTTAHVPPRGHAHQRGRLCPL